MAIDSQSPILVTGAGGFVGRNLMAALQAAGYTQLLPFEVTDSEQTLAEHCRRAAFVFHLAGVNRPQQTAEFYDGNTGLTQRLSGLLEQAGNRCPVLMTSSIQAALDNDYGKSKRLAEQALQAHGLRTGAPVYVFRLEGVFGKWCRPNYNSVVATFCHNIARGLPIQVRDPAFEVPLIYIDDVVSCLLEAMGQGRILRDADGFCRVHPVHRVTLGALAQTLRAFAAARSDDAPTLAVPDLADDSFTKKLYSTYLSYLPEDRFAYDLTMHRDERGSFTEFLRTPERGQVSVNISKPGITKGDHWHNTKNEKFLVVRGQAVIRFRRVGGTHVVEYPVSGERLQVVDIPCGYTHSIENVGSEDLVTVMWANEAFDPARPDTFHLPVLQKP